MNPSQLNKSLLCDYHRDHGHETDRCRSLKFMVEKLIKEGHLRRYVKELDYEVESGQATNIITASVTTPTEPRPAINYILGSLSNDQYRPKRQQNKLLRSAIVKARVNAIPGEGRHEENKPIDSLISFPPVNLNRIIVPHYDALVLTLCINSFNVHRVLIDPGSVTNLLQLPAFEQIKLSSRMLNLARRILSGFNGATTTTLGDASLPMKDRLVTQRIIFSIIEDLRPYNAIIRQAWLHSMKVIPLTYHQTISYLTNVGQVDLLGSQLVAWQCYQLSTQEHTGEKNLENHPLEDQTPA